MSGDLEKLFRLVQGGFRIRQIDIRFSKVKKPELTVKVELKQNDNVQTIVSSDEEFFSYVSHLHSIPHIEDDDSDFVYVDNPNEFFDIQKRIVDMFSGEQKEFIICERGIEELS